MLFDLGLTPAEVRIYQFLQKSSVAVPSLIANSTGESRGRIYQTMRRLVEKGFVREEPTRPIQYSPVPLVDILTMASKRFAHSLKVLQESQARTVRVDDASGSAVPVERATTIRDVLVLSGRKACMAELRRMVNQAEDLFWLIGAGNVAKRLAAYPGLAGDLRAASRRGVEVRLFLPRDPSNAALLGLDSGAGGVIQDIAAGPPDRVTSCVTESSSMEIVVQPDDASATVGADVAIHTRSRAFVRATKGRMQAEATVLQQGKKAALFQWLGPNHGTDLFLGAIQNAKRAVDVIGPSDWAKHLTRTTDEMIQACRRARGRGVRFRAIMRSDPAAESMAAAMAQIWESRHVPWIPVWLTVVDGKQLYQAFPPALPSTPAQFRESNEPNEVQFYQEVFEQLWGEGQPVTKA